jgi:hypothetical protein
VKKRSKPSSKLRCESPTIYATRAFNFAAGDRLMAIGTDEAHEKLNALPQDV